MKCAPSNAARVPVESTIAPEAMTPPSLENAHGPKLKTARSAGETDRIADRNTTSFHSYRVEDTMSDQKLTHRQRHWTALQQQEAALQDEPVLGTKPLRDKIEVSASHHANEESVPRARSAALESREPVRRSPAQPRTAPVTTPYLTVAEAADYTRLSVKTLERYRKVGGGPRDCKAGGDAASKCRVVYHIEDLDQWLRPTSSTSDNRHRR